ncbi:MAG TPA: ketoacyl-ACP synthase III [Patescibacteria group bacterium]|nr:ketoacyl-ACP synthase III [Patescibacteria group bacterium]
MAYIVETSRHIPEKLVRNQDMEQFPARFRELIAEKAGITQRYHAGEEECTSDLAIAAVNKLLKKTGLDPLAVDALICATTFGDRPAPATGTRIQLMTGMHNAFAFDLNSACSSGVFGLRTAAGFVRDGLKNVIVVASEVYSKVLNHRDLTTYPYFGDAAAAVLVSDSGVYEILDFYLGSDGSKADSGCFPGGGTRLHGSKVTDPADFHMVLKGADIYQFACEKGPETIMQLMKKTGLTPDRVIPHQANIHIIKEICRKVAIPWEKFFVNVEKYGNTAGASVLVAFDENREAHPDDGVVILAAFGAGLSWGGCCLRKASTQEARG